MHFDVHFWEAFCFFAFVVMAYAYAKEPFLQYLDEYTAVVKAKIAKADSLCNEAKKNLNHFQELDRSLNKKIKAIHKHTEENIRILNKEASERLAAKVQTQKNMHKEKLSMYDLQDLRHMKEEVVKQALVAVRAYMQTHAPKVLNKNEIESLLEIAKDKNIFNEKIV